MKKYIIIGVILVAILIAPYITGKIVQNRLEHTITLANNKLEKLLHTKDVIKLDYHAGWFTSSAKTTIGDIVINHDILHGPYCTFGIAKIDSSFNIPKETEKELIEFFNGQKPYTITTKFGFSGKGHLQISSPSIGEKALPNKPNIKITWQGLELSSTIGKNTITSSFDIPKFAITKEGKATFVIENIQSQGNGDRLLDNELNFILSKHFKIDSNASIGKIAFKSLDPNNSIDVQVDNITTQIKSNNNNYENNFTIGKVAANKYPVSLSIDNIIVKGTANDPFWILRKDLKQANWNSLTTVLLKNIKLDNLKAGIKSSLDYNQEQQLTDNGDNIGYRELYRVSNINLQAPTYNNFINNMELTYQINGLPKEQLTVFLTDYIEFIKLAFLTGIRQSSSSGFNGYKTMMKYQTQLLSSGQKFAISTLQSTPDIAIDLKLQGSKGDSNITFKASLIKPDNSNNIQNLTIGAIPRINAKLSMVTSETLIDTVMTLAGIDSDQQSIFKQQIKQRYPIIDNNGLYTIDIEFKDSNFYVNGLLDSDFFKKYSQEFR